MFIASSIYKISSLRQERNVYRTRAEINQPSSIRSEMFIAPSIYNISWLRRSKMLFDEVENVLVLERDVKLSKKTEVLVPE
jgi:hypothetical protein